MAQSKLYNLCKTIAMMIPQIKRHVAYTRSLEKQLEEITTHNNVMSIENTKHVKQIESLIIENRERRNLIATLYGLQEYYSDLFIEGAYSRVVTFTLTIGCPIQCRYCPQSQFVKAYMKRTNPVKSMSYETFCEILSKIPTNVPIRFTGFVENFTHPEAMKIFMKALDTHPVMVYSTMYNASIDDYEELRTHPNLKTLSLHLPDCYGNTVFPITDSYKILLNYIVTNPPTHAIFYTSCLGIDGGVAHEIADIIHVSSNAIASYHGLVYENFINHGDAKLACMVDCMRPQNPLSGVLPVLPNGEVLACTQDAELTTVIGNILDVNSLDELLASPARAEFIRGLDDSSLNTICRKCELGMKKTVGNPLDARGV